MNVCVYIYRIIINVCSRSKPCPCYEMFAALYKHTLVWCELSIVSTVNQRCVFTYSHNFDHFHMERQPQILHSILAPTWTTIIYNDPVY
jgi:hypothetical protein